MTTILNDIKIACGVPAGNLGFDHELLLIINSVKGGVVQLGVGDYDTIYINAQTPWVDTLNETLNGLIKHYFILKTRQSFDPIPSESIAKVVSETIVELEGRILSGISELGLTSPDGLFHTHPAVDVTGLNDYVDTLVEALAIDLSTHSIDELQDVDLAGFTDGDLLVYSAGLTKFVRLDGGSLATTTQLSTHTGNQSNPHQVNLDQLGAAAESHDHVEANITDLDKYTQAEVTAFLAGKAAASHTHVEANITDLDKYTQAEVTAFLAGKAAAAHSSNHTDGTDDIQDATSGQKGLATAAQITKLDGIEAQADVTDPPNVAAAGALMTSGGTMSGDIAMADNSLVFDNAADAAFLDTISFKSGLTASQERYMVFLDYDDTVVGRMGWNSGNSLIMYHNQGGPAGASFHPFFSYQITGAGAGVTLLNSASTVYINYDGTATGAGGLVVWDGTSSGAVSIANKYGSINVLGVQANNGRDIRAFATGDVNYTRLLTTSTTGWVDSNNLALGLRSGTSEIKFVNTSWAAQWTIDTSTAKVTMLGQLLIDLRSNTEGLIIQGDAAQTANLLEMQNSAGTELVSFDASGDLEMNDNNINRAVLKDYGEAMETDATSTATKTLDIAAEGNVFDITLTDNCTFTFSNPSPSGTACSFMLILRQDGTGGRTVTWPASVDWHEATAPTLTTTATTGVDILKFMTVDAGTTWFGFVEGQAMG